DHKPYFFLLERVYKSCERRKFSCICHRSSGVAARLRANRSFSCSLSPRTFWIFRRIRATFFCTVKAYCDTYSGSSRISTPPSKLAFSGKILFTGLVGYAWHTHKRRNVAQRFGFVALDCFLHRLDQPCPCRNISSRY